MLAESNVAAVAIAFFILWFLDGAFQSLWIPLYRAGTYLFTAITIFDIPSFAFTSQDRRDLLISSFYACAALISIFSAWVVSRWVYGVGPLRSLQECGSRLLGRRDG